MYLQISRSHLMLSMLVQFQKMGAFVLLTHMAKGMAVLMMVFAPFSDQHGLAIRLLDCYASYFGALTCMAWSPDGRFVLVSSTG